MNKKTAIGAALRGELLGSIQKLREGKIAPAEARALLKRADTANQETLAEVRHMTSELGLRKAARGRPPLPQSEAMAPMTLYLKPQQREKLLRLGGAPWVRERIDKAKEK